jgi:hypothetical protein
MPIGRWHIVSHVLHQDTVPWLFHETNLLLLLQPSHVLLLLGESHEFVLFWHFAVYVAPLV